MPELAAATGLAAGLATTPGDAAAEGLAATAGEADGELESAVAGLGAAVGTVVAAGAGAEFPHAAATNPRTPLPSVPTNCRRLINMSMLSPCCRLPYALHHPRRLPPNPM